jgi:UDP-N-acetylglucosamine 4,6-dehydratase/5-epimerase
MDLVDKRVLIFGGTGSLGRALIRRLSADNYLMVYSRDEAKHWTIRNEANNPNLKFAVGDIRDFARVAQVLTQFKPNIVIIASALKQVDTCELSPYESIQTNVNGTKNVIDAIDRHIGSLPGLSTVLLVSTDKACAPVNVYGLCKGLSERLIASAEQTVVKYIGTRYGNVLDSRGSILPLFRYQAEQCDAITLTHRDMTRFVMTLNDSVDLILTALHRAKPGEIWIPKLRSMRIIDLAEIFSEMSGKPVRVIGLRPGEKIHESLISEPESPRVYENGQHYILRPTFTSSTGVETLYEYTSADSVMTKEELREHLSDLGLLTKNLTAFEGLKIDEIRTTPQ